MPHFVVLVPVIELPFDLDKKDIYDPVGSTILKQWTTKADEYFNVVDAYISCNLFDRFKTDKLQLHSFDIYSNPHV